MRLPPDEVHVWFHAADIAPAALDELSRTLTSAELVRAGRYRFDDDRRRSIVARGSLRLHLSRYSGEPPAGILIAGQAGEKPHAPRTGIQFSVSHAGGLVALAFSAAAPVGVDIERLRPVRDAAGIASRFFSPDEQRAMAASADTEGAFFGIWTAKEAVVKGTGLGLASELGAFTAPRDPGGLRPVETTLNLYAGWCVTPIEPPRPGYRAALAVRLPSAVIRVGSGPLP